LIIGIVAGTFTLIGMRIGERIGAAKRLSVYAETIGGVVLISIGLNILFEHGALSVFFN
jgi:putative Mn2+ efflux pump MntP